MICFAPSGSAVNFLTCFTVGSARMPTAAALRSFDYENLVGTRRVAAASLWVMNVDHFLGCSIRDTLAEAADGAETQPVGKLPVADLGGGDGIEVEA